MSFHAIFAIENSVYCFVLLVQKFDDWLGIIGSGGSENVYRIDLAHFLQELETVGPNIKFELVAFSVKLISVFSEVKTE